MIRKIWSKMELKDSWRSAEFNLSWAISWGWLASWMGMNADHQALAEMNAPLLLCVSAIFVVSGLVSLVMVNFVWGICNLWSNWKEYPPIYSAYDEEGKKHYFDTPEEAHAFAREHPIWLTPRKKDE